MLIRIIIFLLNFFVFMAADAFTSRYTNWFSFGFNGEISKCSQWHYNVYNEARIPTDPARLQEYFLKPAVYYQYNNNWSFWLGYDLIQINSSRINSSVEQRVWPQVIYANALSSKVKIALRTRLENRWLSGNSGLSLRLRERVVLSILHWNSKKIAFNVAEEMLLGVKKTNWVTSNTLDQLRTFLGFGIPLSKVTGLDIGYINVFRPRTPNNQYEHVLACALNFNFDNEKVALI